MINKKLDDITLDDIQLLIDNSVAEGKTIDYKQKISISSDSDRKEYLFDITSFANAAGGDIIYGIKEDKDSGYPIEINGITVENTDRLQLLLDSLIRDSVSPRLIGITHKFINIEHDKFVLITRISKSWNNPHQVTFKGTDKFYSRSNNGKYKLDVFEIRNAFIENSNLSQRIESFQQKRFNNIISNESFAKLLDNGKIILHVLPLVSFDTSTFIDLKEIKAKEYLLKPFTNMSSFSTRFNFDGILSYAVKTYEKNNYAYLQLYKNGIIESVDSWMIQSFQDNRKEFYANDIEELIIDFINKIKLIYDIVNIQPPIVIILAMFGLEGFQISNRSVFNSKTIDRDNLQFQSILIEDWNFQTDELLKPWFDSLWNSFGFEESRSYQSGKWQKIRY